ncbi:MAG: hypothetical protein IKD37_03025 [Clostridia bacterium]|nr:hypothetical protein [Clostridia bacterium]
MRQTKVRHEPGNYAPKKHRKIKKIKSKVGTKQESGKPKWLIQLVFFYRANIVSGVGETFLCPLVSTIKAPDKHCVFRVLLFFGYTEQYQYLIDFKEEEAHDISHTAVSGLRQASRALLDNSILQTDADGNTNAQDVTEMSQSGRQWGETELNWMDR